LTIFIDTSAFLAIFAADDRYHEAAQVTWQALISEEETLFCNNYPSCYLV